MQSICKNHSLNEPEFRNPTRVTFEGVATLLIRDMPTPRQSWNLGFQQVIFKRDLQTGETAHPFFVGPNLLQDPFARRSVVELLRALRSSCDLSTPESAQAALRVIQQAIAAGELVAVRRAGTSAEVSEGSGAGSSGAPPPRRRTSNPPPPSSSSTREEKTWVEVRLVDDDGNPVAGAQYKLKITDGSVREGSLDDDGRVRVNGIDPGSCTVWFPEYDGKEWRPR